MSTKAKNPSNKALQRFVNEGGTTRAGELARKKRLRDANQLGKSIVDIATGEVEDREPTSGRAKQGPRGPSAGKALASRFKRLHGGRHRSAFSHAPARRSLVRAAGPAPQSARRDWDRRPWRLPRR